MKNATDKQRHLYELLKEFDTAMLLTRTADGKSHARPMAVAKLEPDGDAYFVAGKQSPKADEIRRDPNVVITFQSKNQFAAVRGDAELVSDRRRIDELWSEAWKVWFLGGKHDPDISVIRHGGGVLGQRRSAGHQVLEGSQGLHEGTDPRG